MAPGHIGAAVEIALLEVEDDADLVVELEEEPLLEVDEELAFELEDEDEDDDEELAFELEDDDEELAFELEDEDAAELALDVVTAPLEVEALDDVVDVELAFDPELDEVVCAVMLTEFQMYISSLPGPPQNSLELPLQVM